MRLAVNPNDPGHAEYLRRRPVLVFLDGVKVERCVMADDEKGEVECHRVDEQGRPIIEGGDHIATEIKRGKVEIFPFGPDDALPVR